MGWKSLGTFKANKFLEWSNSARKSEKIFWPLAFWTQSGAIAYIAKLCNFIVVCVKFICLFVALLLHVVVLFNVYYQPHYFRQLCARFCTMYTVHCTGVLIISPVCISVCFLFPSPVCVALFCQSFYPQFTQLLLLLLFLVLQLHVCCISEYFPMDPCMWVCAAKVIKRLSCRDFSESPASGLLPTHPQEK